MMPIKFASITLSHQGIQQLHDCLFYGLEAFTSFYSKMLPLGPLSSSLLILSKADLPIFANISVILVLSLALT